MDGAIKEASGERTANERCVPLSVVFGSHIGIFTKPMDDTRPRNVAVLFLNPWGFEEMCTRKFYRMLADQFAAIGIPSLRFDYPGTANAFDQAEGEPSLATWTSVIGRAAAELRALSGAGQVIFVGQGLGATLGLMRSVEEIDLGGIALLAPVYKGRAYLRELSFWSKMIYDGLGIGSELRDTSAGAIAGLCMPPKVASDLKNVDLDNVTLNSATPIFVAERPFIQAGITFRESVVRAGATVRAVPFDGYDALVNNPLDQEFPVTLSMDLVDWVQSLPAYKLPAGQAGRPSTQTSASAEGIRETPLWFGSGSQLYGILCQPVETALDVAVLILTTGYDHQAGWARSSVELARRLAAVGVASLRFDSADVGDSRPVKGRRRQVLYDQKQAVDAQVAADLMLTRGLRGKMIVVGRCSGAYVAFRSTVENRLWNACVVINPVTFRWRFDGLPKTLSAYYKRAFDTSTLRRVMSRDVDIPAAAQNISVRLVDRAALGLSRLLKPALRLSRLSSKVHRDFRVLSDRGVKLAIIYTDGDEGQDDFRINFGHGGEKLSAYPNVDLHVIPDADHNLTPRVAREKMFCIVESLAISLANEASN